jgi:hypothetical protein
MPRFVKQLAASVSTGDDVVICAGELDSWRTGAWRLQSV